MFPNSSDRFPNPFKKKTWEPVYKHFRRDARIGSLPYGGYPEDLRKSMSRAELLRDTFSKKVGDTFKSTGGPNPFTTPLYFIPRGQALESDLERFSNNIRFNRTLQNVGREGMDRLGENFGLLAMEAKGVPRDVVLNNIAPYLQPSRDAELDDLGLIVPKKMAGELTGITNMMTLADYPIDAPSRNANMSPFADAGSIPNLGFGL